MTFDPGRPEDWLCVNSYNCWPDPCDEGCGPVEATLPPVWTRPEADK